VDKKKEVKAEGELQEFHCMGCGKLLFKYAILIGKVECQCPNPKCKTLNTLENTIDTGEKNDRKKQ